MLTVKIDSSRLNQRLNELSDALIGAGQDGDAAMMIEDETRKFLRTVIKLTPPPGLGAAAKQQGEAAVNRDLMKIFTPVEEGLMDSVIAKFGTENINRWMTDSDGKKLHVHWDKVDPLGTGIADFHQKNRDRRGRTRFLKRSSQGWYAPYVITWERFYAYRKKIQDRVGRRKAAWAVSFQSVGGKVARWISRHLADARGECRNQLSTLNHPSITMINRAPGISDDARIVRDAVQIRARAIGRRVRLILSGYSEDIAKGMKISKKVRRTTVDDLNG